MNRDFARRQMVEQQIRTYDVFDPRVLAVFSEVPREKFVPQQYRKLAFSETPLPLGRGQFMMTPLVEGRMIQALSLSPTDDVLEIGTGTGYTCACMSKLAKSVVSVDIFPEFVEAAASRIERLGIENLRLEVMDASRTLPAGRYDAIAVTGSCPSFDSRFFDALKPGGRLFIIVGSPPVMDAERVLRGSDDRPEVTRLFETNVAPLINAPAPPAFRF